MKYFDAHCDTITKIMETGEALIKNTCHIDIERGSQLNGYIQTFAAFIDPEFYGKGAKQRAIDIINKLNLEVSKNTDKIVICKNSSQIDVSLEENKIAALLSIEGGEALLGEIENVEYFYEMGVRSICLTWNYKNEIATGVSDSKNGEGLSEFGKTVVYQMNKLGMLVDVSHLSVQSFWDVVNTSKKPIIASHSNAYKLCEHKRNLDDEQLKAIAKLNGVIGLNLYPEFLSLHGNASLKDVLSHIEYIVSLIGADHIGIGADFDGIEKTPNDILGVHQINKIFNELAKMNYSQDFIDKLAYGNFTRIFKEVCG